MIIMGLDPGLATIGYGIIEKRGSKIIPVDYGVVTTPPSETKPTRLAIIYDSISKLIHMHKPEQIAVEELFFSKNITTGISVAEARGVILLSAIRECGHLFEYTPLQVKQAITGVGRAEKHQVQYMVKSILKLEAVPKPDDAADALAVAICHANTNDYSSKNYIS